MLRLRCLTALALVAASAPTVAADEPWADKASCVGRDEPCRTAARWSAGAEALLLVPRFESNPAYFVTSRAITGNGPPVNAQRVEEFGYNLSVSPRVWLSYSMESGLGARVRWFRFDQDAEPRQVVNPALPFGGPIAFRSVSSTSPLMAISPQTALPAVNSIQVASPFAMEDRLTFTSSLSMDMWDAEAVFSDLRTGCWSFELFGGLRYAHIEQHYDASVQGFLPQVLMSQQTYDGAGPTFGLSGRRQLGQSAFSFYGLGRISFLFGEDEHDSSGLNIGLIPDFTYAFNDNHSSRQRILPVIDIEMGLEGTYPLSRAEAFVRGGVFSQLVPLGSGANGNGNAGLIGLSIGTGVRF